MSETMTLSIENFGGIEAAALAINPGLTLLSGANGAGKTTVLRALASCLRSDTVMPILLDDGKEALLKKESHLLVRGRSGSVTLSSGQGSRRVTWPSNTSKGTGVFPGQVAPSRMALGLIDWMAMPQAVRIKTLLETAAKNPSLSSTITREDLDRAVAGERLDPAMIDWAWQVISGHGFDVAHSEATRFLSESTGGWRATTREAYGEEKAKSYLPPGWEADLVSATQESLQQEVQARRQAVEQAIANQSVGAAEAVRIEAVANTPLPDMATLETALAKARISNSDVITGLQAKLPLLQQEPQSIIDARLAVANCKSRIKFLQAEMAALQSGAPRIDGHCPGCGIALAVHDRGAGGAPTRYGLSFPEGTAVDPSQIDRLSAEIDELTAEAGKQESAISAHSRSVSEQVATIQKELSHAQEAQRQAVHAAEQGINTAKRQMAEISAAQNRLAEIRAKGTGVSAEEILNLRQASSRSETRLKAWEIKQAADRYAEDARQFAVIKEITAPAGLRKAKMDTALAGLNGRCAELSAIANWGTVSLTSDADLHYAGRPYVVCSAAEQYRCRVTMQVLLAVIEQSPILLLDGTDILDSAGRLGMVKLLRSTGIPTVLAMTAKRDYASALTTLFDTIFWVQGGQVTQISTVGQR
ncbi:MAG: AAA family ATPase [Magnetococcales bacterium]|nr:AAA family ATPase [Magnetococcales bacterium]MBF0115291.1 AAA family ATPase [Magnetococcales bacterium]